MARLLEGENGLQSFVPSLTDPGFRFLLARHSWRPFFDRFRFAVPTAEATISGRIRACHASPPDLSIAIASLRFSVGIDGEVFVLNKRDGVIRQLAAVPEPATWAMGLVGAIALTFCL
jgi:hypothetical protein